LSNKNHAGATIQLFFTIQVLFLENKVMMNPLSLLDFPEAKGADEIFVRVHGPMPAESKK
jgi:hypothetical protein